MAKNDIRISCYTQFVYCWVLINIRKISKLQYKRIRTNNNIILLPLINTLEDSSLSSPFVIPIIK
jgi:hypothetical protein